MKQDEIQGLVRSGYDLWPHAWYRFLKIIDPAGAGAWLEAEVGRTTFIQADVAAAKAAPTCRNLAFTCAALGELGLPTEAMRGFDAPYREGMTAPHRSRLLGDWDGTVNDPKGWRWGHGERTPHVLQMLFARTRDESDALLALARSESRGVCEEVGAVCATLVLKQIDATRFFNAEHFGFADGLSQPRYKGLSSAPDALPLGELLLGYADGKGQRAEGPGIDPRLPGADLLPAGPDGDGDFALNGAYLVCRQMPQNVAGFGVMLDTLAARPEVARWAGTEDLEQRRKWVGARIVGRWPNGTPLVTHPAADDPAFDAERARDFDFSGDQGGQRCPYGSHVRRTNPRDSVFQPWATPTPEEAAKRRADADRRRLLRRGRAYGPEYKDQPEAERGLMFICLCSDIERQFEFVQKSWLLNPTFAGLQGETDPLVGVEDTCLTIQADPFHRRLEGVEAHVRTEGGAYFFLPSRSALRYLAKAAQAR